MLIFCTLFDSNYLDKGLVLYRSIKDVLEDFHLYILAMDNQCADILLKLELSNTTTISLEEFEDEELKIIKSQRTKAEYCWTCTASLIDYIFEVYHEEYCTYLDADLYFFQSPKALISEMCENNCSVQIVGHRFYPERKASKQEKSAGKYCVQFNTFKNDIEGRKILRVWKQQCREHCSMTPGEMGDQKYLNDWPEKYGSVHVLENQGGGVAPWNINRYKYVRNDKQSVNLFDKVTKDKFELVFYHFHHLEYIDEQYVDINVYKYKKGVDEELVDVIYFPYLKKIEMVKKSLYREFGFRPVVRKHPGLAEKDQRNILKKIEGKSIVEIKEKIENKIIYILGKNRDMISRKDLEI